MIHDDSDQPATKADLQHALRTLKRELELEKLQERAERAKAQVKFWEKILGGVLLFVLITSWTLVLINLKT